MIAPLIERVTHRDPMAPPSNAARWAAIAPIYRAERIREYVAARGNQNIAAGIGLAATSERN